MEAAVAIASVARVRPLQSIPLGQRGYALGEAPHDCPGEVDSTVGQKFFNRRTKVFQSSEQSFSIDGTKLLNRRNNVTQLSERYNSIVAKV